MHRKGRDAVPVAIAGIANRGREIDLISSHSASLLTTSVGRATPSLAVFIRTV
jgi:hypothetical protein